ncbi:MAG: aspartate aminotransferase family protein [Thaumarchaeota archaeon]|nr:aspartate aminotransferase family protein [Nitrososphaerota archaeon]
MSHEAEKETEAFRARTKRSAQVYARARKVTPFGVHSNYRFTDPYPLYASVGKGSRIWDVDGNEYLDFCMGFGALSTGHAHPALVEAMTRRIKRGTLLGFETEEAASLGELINTRFNLDLVRFSSTGLEGTQHAIRLARAYTHRNLILKFEGCYHGSHDGVLVNVKPSAKKSGGKRLPNQVPASLGIPDEVVRDTIVAQFNDLTGVEDLFSKNEDEIAAVILEPIPMNMGFVLPVKGFLEGLRKLCTTNAAVLIFDEVKTSGKFYGGAESKFHVQPDLKVLGKAIAGGYPLSAVGGKKMIMDVIAPGVVSHAGTFNSNPVSVTAGLVTLDKVLTETSMARASKLGDQLGRACRDLISDSGLEARIQWDGLSGTIHFTKGDVHNWRDFLKCNLGRWWTYYLSMLNRGVIPMATGPDEQWTVSVQHSKEDIGKHVEVFKEVVVRLRTAGFHMPMVEAV